MEQIKEVYIHSINKKIPIEEYKKYCYKEGHIYKINPHYFHKCIYVDPKTFQPKVESLTILPNINGGEYQLIYNIEALPIPGLDFVNDIMCGKITEVDPEKFEQLVNTFKQMSHTLENIALGI
jgi:hypothetical protein